LLLINNTGDPHTFELPRPILPWWFRVDTANPSTTEREFVGSVAEVESHSVQLLTAIVAADESQMPTQIVADAPPEPEETL
jgi:hypothetical protein